MTTTTQNNEKAAPAVQIPVADLRDYFAAKALNGIEASQGNSGAFVSTAEKVAARAYELADAMLKERAK